MYQDLMKDLHSKMHFTRKMLLQTAKVHLNYKSVLIFTWSCMSNKDLIVKGKISKNIEYTKDDEVIYIRKGKNVLVNLDYMVALIGDDHIDISLDEVEILLAN